MRADPLWRSESISLEVVHRSQLFNLDGDSLVTLVPSQVAIFSGVPCAVSAVESPLVLESGRQGAFNFVDDFSADVG